MVVRFQSSMGRSLKRVDSDDLNVKGLVLATVSKINYKYQSVEVKVNNLTLGSRIGDDGSLAVPYPKSFIGRTPEGSVFGTKPLITEGSVVLIGFLNDDINSPIILSVYGDNEQNKMINTNPLDGGKFDTESVYKYSSSLYEILPSLNYKYDDGEGTSIRTYNGKSFFSMTSGEEEKPQATDFYTGTEYQDLFTSYYGNKTLIEARIQKAPNMLFKHQGVFYDDGTPDNHITTLFISERGDIRASVLNTETQKRTTQEMSSDGSYRVIKQDDDLMLDEAQVWIEYGISEDNKFYIKNDKHKFEFTDEGIYIDDKPMLENLDESIAEAMKNLNEIQKELDDINYLLEGVGKDNLEELIESTKESIEASKKATSDVNRLTTQIAEVSGRTEGIITQFQKFRDETFKDFYEDASTVINEVNQNFPTMKTDVKTLKTKVDNLEKTEIPNIKTRLTELENNNNNADKIISDRGEHIGAMIQLEENVTVP
ncbi:coiled-coil domain-containing protein, partial [Klebsiella pneumoniae]